MECCRCRRKGDQKFTKENNMIPDEVPPALQNFNVPGANADQQAAGTHTHTHIYIYSPVKVI